jgi:endonuclease YncB( thermonuclease family)
MPRAKKEIQTPQPDWLWRYRVTVLRVVDGDTVELLFDQGMGNWSMETCRLYGINAVELRQDGGEAAKTNLEAEIEASSISRGKFNLPVVWARTIKNRAESKEIQEKYGRYLVELYSTAEEMDRGFAHSINQGMIENGFAKPYYGIGKVK